MSSISGIQGLKPTIEIIKYTKKIAIANKEAIICGWDLIEKRLDKHKTDFIKIVNGTVEWNDFLLSF